MDAKSQGVIQGLARGLNVGVQNFIQGRRANTEQIDKVKSTTQEKQALYNLLGLQTKIDPITKEITALEPNPNQNINPPLQGNDGNYIPQGISQPEGFQRVNPLQEAVLTNKLTAQDKSIYTNFIKRQEPTSIHDKYINIRSKYDPKTKAGVVIGTNKTTGKVETIQPDPYYQLKSTNFVVNGMVKVGNRMVGVSGHRTKVTKFEDGHIETQDLGRVSSDKSNKNFVDSQLTFESNMSDVQEKLDNVKNKMNRYLSGKFADTNTREDYRAGINSDLNSLAFKVAKLGTKKAQEQILKIYTEGKKQLSGKTGVRMSVKQFYELKKQEIIDEWMQWDYNDAQVILKFLEIKYGSYTESQNPIKTKDEFNFDNFKFNPDK